MFRRNSVKLFRNFYGSVRSDCGHFVFTRAKQIGIYSLEYNPTVLNCRLCHVILDQTIRRMKCEVLLHFSLNSPPASCVFHVNSIVSLLYHGSTLKFPEVDVLLLKLLSKSTHAMDNSFHEMTIRRILVCVTCDGITKNAGIVIWSVAPYVMTVTFRNTKQIFQCCLVADVGHLHYFS